MEIAFFNDDIKKYLTSLEISTRSKVSKQIKLLEEYGNMLGMPYSKQISRGLFELRIRGVQEIRVLYTFHRQKVFIVHAFTKKSQKIPLQEINLALARIKFLT